MTFLFLDALKWFTDKKMVFFITRWLLIKSQDFGSLKLAVSDKTSLSTERAGGEKGEVLIARLLSRSCQTFSLTQTKLQPHDPHLPYYILQLFPSYSSVCANADVCVCVFAHRKQRPRCDCAVRCSCVRFRCFYTKDWVKDEWSLEVYKTGLMQSLIK